MEEKRKSRKSVSRKSVARKSVARKSVARKSVARKSVARKSVAGKRRQSMRKKSSKKQSSTADKSLGDPMARRGRDTLTYPNGDKYEGDWLAVYPDIFVRDGEGTHTCSDGTIFYGLWELDLLDSGSIFWPCGQKYSGDMRNGKMHGIGTYTFPGRGELSGTFENNLPVGNVVFLDMAGMKYIGRVEPNASTVRLRMLNHLMGGFSKNELILPIPPKGPDEEDDDSKSTDASKRTKKHEGVEI